MNPHHKAVKSFQLSLLILVLSLLTCGADPLNRGSVSLKNSTEPMGFNRLNDPLLIGDFSGTPLLLYVRGKWCPLCKNLDDIINDPQFYEKEAEGVTVVVLELVDGTMLDESGIRKVPFAPDQEEDIPLSALETKGILYYMGESERAKKILKLKRIPALIAFNRRGQIAGTAYGSQTGMRRKVGDLVDEITRITKKKAKEETGF